VSRWQGLGRLRAPERVAVDAETTPAVIPEERVSQ
jgi:hypothetical protein